jgi:hypothetical protein
MSRTRIGATGAGVIAQRHVRRLLRFDDVQVAAVADVQADRAAELAAGVGATPYDSAARMPNTERSDAVWLCVRDAVQSAGEETGEAVEGRHAGCPASVSAGPGPGRKNRRSGRRGTRPGCERVERRLRRHQRCQPDGHADTGRLNAGVQSLAMAAESGRGGD